MNVPPILKCSNWDELIAAIAARPDCSALAGINPTLACAVLAAPAAVALWIARRMPQLLAVRRLRLLLIGAESVDAVDQGRWYAILPTLLGADFKTAVTLVGADLDPSFVSPAGALAPSQPARCARARLNDFLSENGSAEFDIAVIFHPGLGKHRGWLEDGSFARLIAGGVQLVASAYEEDEFEMDRWVVESYGYSVQGQPVINPFFLDLDHEQTRVRWGRALWGFGPSVPAAGFVPDAERLAALDNLTRMVMHSMTHVGAPGLDPGARVELKAQTGDRMELMHIFDNRFVDPATFDLLRLTPEGGLEKCGKLSGGELADYPGAGGRALERAIWAARIKAAHLLPSYPPPKNPVAPEEKAREMYATLRSRAAKLFGK
ncbi:MAG: hypothetical protein AMJ67_00325 [Betaproteobacteria bacterium SG8_41]|jgi:hypothetical protein|nr:MAG: hypothetical protein AMJ67_00325 [Betaproteobacteria bacterium SG8_41]